MNLLELGTALRERREALGIPRTELARRVGVTPTYIWLVETAKPRPNGEPSRPTAGVLERWTEALGMDRRYRDQALRLAGYGEVETVSEVGGPVPYMLDRHEAMPATRAMAADFSAAPMQFRQPRDLQARVLVESLREVLALAGRTPDTWDETAAAVESILAWLRFRLREPLAGTESDDPALQEPLLPRFARHLWLFSPDEPLADAISLMREWDFSQVIVQRDGALGLLTNEGIARWFEHHPDESPAEVTIGDALAYDAPGSSAIMSGRQTTGDAMGAFSRALLEGRPRLSAIIITASGSPTDSPRGIVTPWDLVGISA